MKNNVYTLFNNLSNRYTDVMAYPTDGFAAARCREFLTASGKNIAEWELCNIGSIDVSTGVLEAQSPVRVPLSEDNKLPCKEVE